MTFTLRPVDPDADLDLIYGWVTEPRAKFWGMTEHSRQEVAEIYQFIDSQPSHHAYLVHEDDRPVALAQTYQPEHDPIGDCYDRQPGDLGVHLFLAPTDNPRSGFTLELTYYLLEFLFYDPAVKRLVGEPDHLNTKSVTLARRFTTSEGRIDVGDKRAELFLFTRSQWEQLRQGRHVR